jgi:hypothetical protein
LVTNSADKNKRRSFELARFIAAKLVEDPTLIEQGRQYLERHVKGRASQRRYYDIWSHLLTLEPREIAARLIARTAEGDLLRDTRPVFYIIEAAERAALFRETRQPLS